MGRNRSIGIGAGVDQAQPSTDCRRPIKACTKEDLGPAVKVVPEAEASVEPAGGKNEVEYFVGAPDAGDGRESALDMAVSELNRRALRRGKQLLICEILPAAAGS
jgi:hypothetical protein